MEIQAIRKDFRYGDGLYRVSAPGYTAADLYWGLEGRILQNWTSIARVSLDEAGNGSFRYTGMRAVPPEADCVVAVAGSETVSLQIEKQPPLPAQHPFRVAVMSDLHLSRKPWRVRKAFTLAKDADLILMPGDLTNDGTPEQLQRMQALIEELLPSVPVLAVTGNHDIPNVPRPWIWGGILEYPDLESWLLHRQPHPFHQDESGAWSVSFGNIRIVGLNVVTHFRRFTIGDGAQIRYLQSSLERYPNRLHLVLCHAPLMAHNPQKEGRAYFNRNPELQKLLDHHKNVIFLSGHTHISLNSPGNPIQFDGRNLYINDGSVCPTDLMTKEDQIPACFTDGNLLWLNIWEKEIYIAAQSRNSGEWISRGCYRFHLESNSTK